MVERVRHLKRGTEYEVLARGVRLQGDAHEPETLVLYRGEDGQVCAREEGEFDDGRFERLPDLSDHERREHIRALVRKHGGIFHGPRVEHLSIEEQAFWRFLDEVIVASLNLPLMGI